MSEVKVVQDEEEQLLQPYHHIASVPGKSLRGLLIDAVNLWLQLPPELTAVIKAIIEKLHHASVLTQDIEGHSRVRRGVPVAHAIFGVPTTLNCANLAYFLALDQICRELPPGPPPHAYPAAAVAAYREEMEKLHVGLGLDILWRDSSVAPSEAEYTQMAVCKSGWLFRLALKLMLACSSVTISESTLRDYLTMVDTFAVYFQIRDDYLNLTAPPPYADEGKAFCEDITEGKFSYVVLHSIHAAAGSDDIRLSRILRQHTTDVALLKYALQLMRQTRSFHACHARLQQAYSQVVGFVAKLGGNPALLGILARMHGTIADVDPDEAVAQAVERVPSYPPPTALKASPRGSPTVAAAAAAAAFGFRSPGNARAGVGRNPSPPPHNSE